MTTPSPPTTSAITRTLGALALLVVAGVHYQQYEYDFYSAIPTIGPLFLALVVSATTLGLFLLSPVRPLRRLGRFPDQLAALAGVGVAAGALVGLLISEQTPLFGFQEHGYRFAIVLTLASEPVVITMLSLYLWQEHRSVRRRPTAPAPRSGGQSPLTPTPAP
jgi:hypothetical protein